MFTLLQLSRCFGLVVYDHFGPFCDTPVDRVCQSEDVALCNKIRQAGYRVGVSPKLLL